MRHNHRPEEIEKTFLSGEETCKERVPLFIEDSVE